MPCEYIAPFTFDFDTFLIRIDSGVVDVDCTSLYTAIKLVQACETGIIHDRIAEGSGLNDLGPGVQVGLTVKLLGMWQLSFAPGNYIARVAGGNLIGGPSADPIAYTAGVQTLLIQSAASTVVNTAAVDPWAQTLESNLTAAEIMRLLLAVQTGKTEITDLGNGNATVKFKSANGAKDRVESTMAGSERTTVTLDPT